jgi:nitroreductase
MEAIYKRRSIRKYRNTPVDRDLIHKIIKAGMNAPSAGNEQPWHFIVVDDREILDTIPSFHPHSRMLLEAPVAIVVCAETSNVKYPEYWPQDCAAATENMLLAIADLDLGGVWLGVYPREDRVEKLRNLLGIPAHIIPFSMIALGYPAEQKPPKDIFEPHRIKHNSWDKELNN